MQETKAAEEVASQNNIEENTRGRNQPRYIFSVGQRFVYSLGCPQTESLRMRVNGHRPIMSNDESHAISNSTETCTIVGEKYEVRA